MEYSSGNPVAQVIDTWALHIACKSGRQTYNLILPLPSMTRQILCEMKNCLAFSLWRWDYSSISSHTRKWGKLLVEVRHWYHALTCVPLPWFIPICTYIKFPYIYITIDCPTMNTSKVRLLQYPLIVHVCMQLPWWSVDVDICSSTGTLIPRIFPRWWNCNIFWLFMLLSRLSVDVDIFVVDGHTYTMSISKVKFL